MGTRLLRRRGLAAAGVLAAGVFSGCHSPNQFVHTGVARGDLVGSSPAFPTATRIPAERVLSATPGAGGMMVVSGDPAQPMMTTLPMTATQVVDSASMMMNPGEVISQAGGPTPATPPAIPPAPPMTVQSGATLPPTSMPFQNAAVPPMPVQAITVQTTGMSPTIPGTPVTTTMAPPAAPAHGTGTPILMLIQGPNGPQYVITEVLAVVPLPSPTATPAPMPTPAPVPAAPISMSAPFKPATVMPAAAAMPEAGPAPQVTPVALPTAEPTMPVKPAPDPMPTLTAPPPAVIPPPGLPPTVSMKPATGPALPPMGAGPTVTQAGSPKLPPATGAFDDDIPAAPVFLPVAK